MKMDNGFKMIDCSKCVHYNYEQGMKLFGHPCNLNGQLKDVCDNYKEIISMITSCPVCGEPIKIVQSDTGVYNVVCENPLCPGKLENFIDHFCSKKGLDIKGLSKATIRKLIDWEWLSSIKDIFSLKEHREEWILKEGFGEKSVDKILLSIEQSKNTELWRIISAISIPLIGVNTSKDLAEYFKTWENFRKATDFSHIDNFGEAMSDSLLSYDYSLIDSIISYFTIAEVASDEANELPLKDKVFCLTGKSSLGSRDKVRDMIKAAGGIVTDTISAKTDYLLANKEENTSKYKNAKKFNVTIINDEQLIKFFDFSKNL